MSDPSLTLYTFYYGVKYFFYAVRDGLILIFPLYIFLKNTFHLFGFICSMLWKKSGNGIVVNLFNIFADRLS